MNFGTNTATRGDSALSKLLVGKDHRVFDRKIANGLGTLVPGQVMSLNASTGTWRKLNGSDTTVGILLEPVTTGYAGTPTVPILQEGAVVLSGLTGADAGWKVGTHVSGLILC
jgi:hypothetical protein